METAKRLTGGRGVEFQHFANRIVQGMMVLTPTNASTQATGTGALDLNVDIELGILAVGSTVREYDAQADYALLNESGALVDGESLIMAIVAYKSRGDNTIYLLNVKGAAAITGSQVAPTDAEIEVSFAADTYWMKIAEVTVNRTGDTSVTQSQDNTVRNTLVPGTVHYGTNPLP